VAAVEFIGAVLKRAGALTHRPGAAAKATAAKFLGVRAPCSQSQGPISNTAVEGLSFGLVSLSYRRRMLWSRSVTAGTWRLKYRRQARRHLGLRRIFVALSLGRGGSVQRTLSRPGIALPNPSIKPSPNSKAPGPRYSALSLVLQRGPGASLLVPAYVER